MFRTFKQLAWFFRTNKLRYVTSFAMLLLSDCIALIIPWMVGFLTDHIMHSTLARGTLLQSGSFLMASVFLLYACDFFWSYFIFAGSSNLVRDTRARLMSKFLSQSPRFFEENTSASLLSKTMNDVDSLEIFAGFGVMCLADASLYPLIVLAFMIVSISWEMTLLALLPILLILPFSRAMGRKLYDLYDEVQKTYEALYEQVLENIAGIRLTRAYRMEKQVEENFRLAIDKTYEKTMKYNRIEARLVPFNRLCSAISLIAAMIAGAYLLSLGRVSIGDIISFNIYLGLLVWPMIAFGEYTNAAQQASASMSRIQELFDYREDYRDQEDAKMYRGQGDYQFQNFSFHYRKANSPALSDLSFTLKSGQTLGIVGRTGSGKTTLAKQFLHIYPLKGEQLILGGLPIWAWQLQSIREQSGYVPQEHALFSLSIRDNVRLASPEATDEEVDAALAFADMSQDIAQFPDGGDTIVGERGITLSGGQKQRVAIARAVLSSPDLLILDDSLSAVDSQTESRILSHIKASRSGKSTVITAHRLSAVTHADLILVLDAGKLIQAGVHETLLSEDGWYREQYLLQEMGGGDSDA